MKNEDEYCCNDGMLESGWRHVYHGNYSWQVILYPVRRSTLSVALLYCVVDEHDTPENINLIRVCPCQRQRICLSLVHLAEARTSSFLGALDLCEQQLIGIMRRGGREEIILPMNKAR